MNETILNVTVAVCWILLLLPIVLDRLPKGNTHD